jgi:hypothetical protein
MAVCSHEWRGLKVIEDGSVLEVDDGGMLRGPRALRVAAPELGKLRSRRGSMARLGMMTACSGGGVKAPASSGAGVKDGRQWWQCPGDWGAEAATDGFGNFAKCWERARKC